MIKSMPSEVSQVFDRMKVLEPHLSEKRFFQLIATEWLECYRSCSGLSLPKNQVVLRNNLKLYITASGLKQKDIARAIGVHPSYLSEVISGRYEPSIKVVLLLLEILDIPPAKLPDVFYLEPAE
ncbi:MAG: helix-turn-helix transcriptional regulator [Bacilli bacterium]